MELGNIVGIGMLLMGLGFGIYGIPYEFGATTNTFRILGVIFLVLGMVTTVGSLCIAMIGSIPK